jgi:hypothetical protein
MNAIEWQESTVLITGGTVHQSVTPNAENEASVKSDDPLTIVSSPPYLIPPIEMLNAEI